MEGTLAIIGFYFTLVGFVSGLFFTRLDSWYGQVREFSGTIKFLEKETDKIEKSKKARITSHGLRESAPRGSFIAVGSFTSALTILTFFLPFTVTEINPFVFLRLPLITTVLIYWIGGIILLQKGGKLLDKADELIQTILP